jgi:hypothetical protein
VLVRVLVQYRLVQYSSVCVCVQVQYYKYNYMYLLVLLQYIILIEDYGTYCTCIDD